MKIRLFAAIRGFNLTGTLGPFLPPNVTLHAPKTNLVDVEQFPEHFIFQIGTLNLAELWDHHYFLYQTTTDEYANEISSTSSPSLISHNELEQLDLLAVMLWAIKDCSCFCPKGFMILGDFDNIIMRSRNMYISNAKGKYETTCFTSQEIEDACKFRLQLIKLLGAIPDDDFEEKVSINITSSQFTLKKYSYNRVARAFYMLIKARSNDLLPYKVAFYIAALESFFSTSAGEIQDKIKLRTALTLGLGKEKRSEIKSLIKTGYQIRSSYFHGDNMPKKLLDQETISKISQQLDQLLREIFLKVVYQLQDKFILENEKFDEWFDDLIFTKTAN